MRTHSRRDEGFALILVIWALGLIGLLTLNYISTARLRLHAGANIAASAKAETLAEAAVNIAILDLENATRGAARIARDGTPFICRLPQSAIGTISLEDEAGKLDLNASSEPYLAKVLAGFGVEPAGQLAAAIASFRSARISDDVTEDRAYAAAGRPFGPRKALFQSALELDQVIGMSPEAFKRLLPFLTVNSLLPEPDLSVAPPALFAVLTSMPGSDISALVSHPFPNSLDRQAFPRRPSPPIAALIHAEVRVLPNTSFVREALVTARREASGTIYWVKEWRRGSLRYEPNLSAIIASGQQDTLPDC